MKNKAEAIWKGKGVDGKGVLNTTSNALRNASYSYITRTENTNGTNPEELIAAAHAGCFAMKLAFAFETAGYVADEINASCEVTFEAGVIKSSHIEVEAKVKGIEKEEFDELISDSGKNCPVSKLLNTDIKVNAVLL
ncbi:MAG TPA: OsmC family peroxiredoxin [Cytophaga sp.]|jgi:osmotically inducible protein OsmC|nr:OsmC family peroxiredoxin [Cytophaga sp.]